MANKTRDLVRALHQAADTQASMSRDEPAAAGSTEPSPAAQEPDANGIAPAGPSMATNGRATAEARRTAEKVRSLDRAKTRRVYGVTVPNDDEVCQYTVRVPKWLRHAIHQHCMMHGLSSQEFGTLAIGLLLEELEGKDR